MYLVLIFTGCYYKSVVYQKGQTWEDGCKYSCTCIDDMSGQYKCTEKYVHIHILM